MAASQLAADIGGEHLLFRISRSKAHDPAQTLGKMEKRFREPALHRALASPWR
jgi:hypothetical protein